ncbi:MAG: L-aspartate oxidase [Dactylosporangium sp.]|nr:L-aspartate oxidase [Dactylosporangium sp.]NNJ63014.1 L-aspartate oxidase [Dactylosporangium sp.]
MTRSGLPRLGQRLRAPDPGWFESTDVVVVGSGIAGLAVALHLREAGLHVTVVTKVNTDDGSTRWAQGGIAAVLDPTDSVERHAHDTMVAGAGLCDPVAVDLLVREGPGRVRELMRWGAGFDRAADGGLLLTREGGHHANRVVHAGGDATGAEIQRALHTAVCRDPWIRLFEHSLAIDLLQDAEGRACGVTLHVLGEGTPDGVGAVLARAVVLASGGMGQVYAATTNPVVSTGDGVALALRAGAAVTDVEFVQFHPTALLVDGPPGTARPSLACATQQPLVSEALRGEGGYLRDDDGRRFMVGLHELAELAPRDVVAKASHRVMRAAGTRNVWLDARHLGATFLAGRFPTIVASCLAAGIDPAKDLIPVAPAAHYASGGVRTDRRGRTTIPGLYACGEVACTGVHGANRLASNSLLEGLVFARRIADDVAGTLPGQCDPINLGATGGWALDPTLRPRLQQAMSQGAGVLRGGDSLGETLATVAALAGREAPADTASWETANLVTVAAALLAAALRREETRGSHWREDFPDARDDWRGHLMIRIDRAGTLAETWEPL